MISCCLSAKHSLVIFIKGSISHCIAHFITVSQHHSATALQTPIEPFLYTSNPMAHGQLCGQHTRRFFLTRVLSVKIMCHFKVAILYYMIIKHVERSLACVSTHWRKNNKLQQMKQMQFETSWEKTKSKKKKTNKSKQICLTKSEVEVNQKKYKERGHRKCTMSSTDLPLPFFSF